ncbi:MAG: aspartate carbamoyltransferase [Candidatus Anstonellales archaeon]
MRHLISIRDLSRKQVEKYFRETEKMERALEKGRVNVLSGKIIATLFFEPSTRTKISFQAAAKRLGADVVDFNQETSSLKKGESFLDTIRMVDGYVDGMIIRHESDGSARLASEVATHPVINGGDGANQHPTQTLIDLYAIKKFSGRVTNLHVTLFGDLKHARAMRSFLYGVSMFGNEVDLCSPPGLGMDENVISEIKERFGVAIREVSRPQLSNCDVLYVCRIQKERFSDPYEAVRVQQEFSINRQILRDAKKDMVILHPLPRIEEISRDIDSDKRARYFEQAKLGVPVRMAILVDVVGRGY